jgi:hypothetical protein
MQIKIEPHLICAVLILKPSTMSTINKSFLSQLAFGEGIIDSELCPLRYIKAFYTMDNAKLLTEQLVRRNIYPGLANVYFSTHHKYKSQNLVLVTVLAGTNNKLWYNWDYITSNYRIKPVHGNEWANIKLKAGVTTTTVMPVDEHPRDQDHDDDLPF